VIGAAMLKPLDCARHGSTLKLHRGETFGEVSIVPLQPRSPANLPITGTGTALAISNITSGLSALSGGGTGRGGARNRADRESDALTAAQVANLRAAKRHAEAIGLPFTRMISIHWQAAGVPLAGMAKATGRFTDLMAKALSRHGSSTAWLWTHENVPSHGNRKGGHCHMLAYVPATLVPVLTGLQRGWLRRITGRPYLARVIYSRPIGGRLGLEAGNPELHAVNLAVAFGYVCKGAPQAILDHFDIEREHKPGGRVIGKRCGTSQNIGAKARKAED
jgi:hypothetical protein